MRRPNVQRSALVHALLFAVAVLLAPGALRAQDPPQPAAGGEKKPAADARTPDQKVAETLATQKVSLNFNEAPVTDILAFLREFTSINIVLDEGLRRLAKPVAVEDLKVTLQLEEVPAQEALTKVLAPLGLKHGIAWGCVIVSTPERLTGLGSTAWCTVEKDAAAWKAALAKTWDTLRIDLDFTDATVMDMLDFLREFTKTNIVVKGNLPEQKMTVQMKELPCKAVVSVLAWLVDADLVLADEALVMTPREKAPPKPDPK